MARLASRPPTAVPPDIPDHLANPVIQLDPEADSSTRRFQAYSAFREYYREVSRWCREHHPGVNVYDLLEELGTNLLHFSAVADALPRQRY